ncbi:MAG: DUF1801 domain-containing protein [Gemmatimonadaceae bacterium]
MPRSSAPTVAAYLAELPPDRRKVIAAVRKVIRANLPKGYQEGMGFGMIGYVVPLRRYPDTYNQQPLVYAGLAAQKNAYSLYLMCAYAETPVGKTLRDGFRAAGKKLDMGKACIRFRSLDDLPLDVIATAVAAVPMDTYVEIARKAHEK